MNHSERIELVKARYSASHELDNRSTNFGTGKGDPMRVAAGRELEHHGFTKSEDGSFEHDELPEHKIMIEDGGSNPEALAWEHHHDGEVTKGTGRDELIDHATGELKAARRERADSPEKYGTADSKIEKTMHEFKEGELHSGSKSGPEVTNRKQAVAIALSQARKAGANIPPK